MRIVLENQTFDKDVNNLGQVMLSLVVPVFNAAESIRHFVAAVDEAIADAWPAPQIAPQLEIIFIDDGSTDGTSIVVRSLRKADKRLKLLTLSRNFGKEAALSAGLDAASGHAAIPMDVDLQDPPEVIRPMVEKWLAGAKVVNARRCDRSADTLFKRSTSRLFYRTINMVADHKIADDVGDFRLLDRDAIEVLKQMTEHTRFNKGLFSWIGFTTETVEYVRPEREVGTSKWRTLKLLNLALDGIVSSTTLPLRIWTIIGALISLGAVAYSAFLLVYTLTQGADVPGYASIMIAVLMLGGLNLLSLGLIGEYLGRVAIQVRGRPLYVIESREGF